MAPSSHPRLTKESSKKDATKGGGVACSELHLPFILSNFVDHKQQKRLSIKIMLPSGSTSDGVRVRVSPDGMSLWVFCRYGSNFTDPQRHRECFVNNEGFFQFHETDMRMVAFAQASSCLPRTSKGSCWGKMTVDLPFQVEDDLYNEEDDIKPQDFFMCDKMLFMGVELVGVDRAQPKLRLNTPSFRVVGDRASQKQHQGRRYQGRQSHFEVNPPTPQPEVKDPSRSVKGGKSFFKKQSRNKPASVRHTKESNAADHRASKSYKESYKSVSEEELVPVPRKPVLLGL